MTKHLNPYFTDEESKTQRSDMIHLDKKRCQTGP